MNNGLEVALVSSEYPPLSIGGVSAVCYELSVSLAKNGVSTTVFTAGNRSITVERVNKYLKVVRFPVTSVPPRHFWFQVQNISPLLRMLGKFDIIHDIDTQAALLAYFRNRQKPFVTHVHGCKHCEAKAFLKSPFSSWTPGDFAYFALETPLNEFLTNTCMSNSDYLIVCNASRVEEMKRRNPKLDFSKISVIYNGIDFDRIDPENIGAKEKEGAILYYGRLYYNKGIVQLVNAIALVRKEFPNLRLDICGKGPLENKLRLLVKKLKLTENVQIHGYTKYPDLVEKIRSASVITLPSLYEGQPVAALEAMAHKKPVIMYDFPFSREFIKDWHDGMLARPRDVEDLAKRIGMALSDKTLREKLSQNAYERVKKNHNWATLIHKYIDLYSKLKG